MEKRKVIRTCIVCRKKGDKEALTKIVKNENGFEVDFNKNKKGRGCYVCKELTCRENLIAKKALNRAYKMNVNNENYGTIKNGLEKEGR